MRKVFVLMLALVMVLSLAACGGVPKEKLEKMDSIVTNLDTLVTETKAEIEKMNNTGYEDVQSYYDTNMQAVQQMEEEYEKMKKALSDNRDSMSEEQVDAAITGLEDMLKQLTDTKNSAVEEVGVIQSAIKEAQVSAAQAVSASIKIPVEIINDTGVDFYALAMSPTNQDTWGDNLLTEVLEKGTSGVTQMTFTPDSLMWDILVQDQEGNQLTFMGLDFSVAPTENAKLAMSADEGGYYAEFVQ